LAARILSRKSDEFMGYGIGALLALSISLLAWAAKLDRDRAFYQTVLMVIAPYYVLFAVMGGTVHALLIESIVMVAFLVFAVAGFKLSLWISVAALVGHGVFDFFHGRIITNDGVPGWWPAFCLAFDVCAGGCLALLLRRSYLRPN
jgi:hypothetical protein